LLVKLLAYKKLSRFTPCARPRLPRRRRPPLPPLGEHRVPVDFLAHPRAPAFPVNHNTCPSHVLIKLSHPFAGARASAAAAGPPPSSSLLRRSSKPSDVSGTFPGSHGSSPCSTWLSPGPSLTAVELPAGVPPLFRRRRSPESSPVDPPPPIGRRRA
jgi:hypothetical protein